MNNLESFHVNEGAEGIDNGAFERLREKMAQARAQIKKDKKQEASQVKKDNVLFNVLMEFIKHLPADHPTVKGIVSCLSANLPSLVILSVISLNYKSIEKALPAQSADQNLPQVNNADIPNIQKLILWLQRVQLHIQTAKESDLRKIYLHGKIHPSLKGLLVHTLTEYFKTIPQEQVSVDQVGSYIETMVSQLEQLNPNKEIEE